jgi:hypothetical protein
MIREKSKKEVIPDKKGYIIGDRSPFEKVKCIKYFSINS